MRNLIYAIEENNYIEFQNLLQNINDILTNDKFRKQRLEYNKINNFKSFVTYILNIYNNFKIMKQYENIISLKIKEILNNYVYKPSIDMKYFNLNNIFNLVSKLKEIKEIDRNNTYVVELFEYLLVWLKFSNRFMDFYLMSRLFRNFKYKQYENVKSPENVIIYVGNDHANVYRNLLKQMTFKEHFHFKENEYKNDYCIDISKLNYPLFKLTIND